jgi:hypothetical protein
MAHDWHLAGARTAHRSTRRSVSLTLVNGAFRAGGLTYLILLQFPQQRTPVTGLLRVTVEPLPNAIIQTQDAFRLIKSEPLH